MITETARLDTVPLAERDRQEHRGRKSGPWASIVAYESIVAYDLNAGIIKWRAPLGSLREFAAKGITDTGNPVRLQRNGLAATAGGLIFAGTNGDGYVRAFDKRQREILWEHDVNANPEGLPSVFAVNGRQYRER